MTSEKGKSEGAQGNPSLGFVSSPRAHYISQGEGAAMMGQWVGSGLEDDAEASVGPLEHAGGRLETDVGTIADRTEASGGGGTVLMRKEKPGVQPEGLVKERGREARKGTGKSSGKGGGGGVLWTGESPTGELEG